MIKQSLVVIAISALSAAAHAQMTPVGTWHTIDDKGLLNHGSLLKSIIKKRNARKAKSMQTPPRCPSRPWHPSVR